VVGFAVVGHFLLGFGHRLAVVSCSLPFKGGDPPGVLMGISSRLAGLSGGLAVDCCGLAVVSSGLAVVSSGLAVAGGDSPGVVVGGIGVGVGRSVLGRAVAASRHHADVDLSDGEVGADGGVASLMGRG